MYYVLCTNKRLKHEAIKNILNGSSCQNKSTKTGSFTFYSPPISMLTMSLINLLKYLVNIQYLDAMMFLPNSALLYYLMSRLIISDCRCLNTAGIYGEQNFGFSLFIYREKNYLRMIRMFSNICRSLEAHFQTLLQMVC